MDEVPGIPLSRYAEDFDLPELVRASKSRINGLRVKVKGDVFLADIAPLQSSEHDDSEAMAGAVLTEQIFAIPGFGKMLVDGVFNRDYAVVQGVVLVSATLYVLLNLAGDVLAFLVNPRLRGPA